MDYRGLGKTGLKVSAVGLGCMSIAEIDDKVAVATVHKALDMGITLFDTADAYGNGKSEEILGRILPDRRDDVVIATKVGHFGDNAHPIPFTSPDHVYLCCDASLYRLKTDFIDVYQCHFADLEDPSIFLEAFERLKEKGKIRFYGISTGNLKAAEIRAVEVLRRFNRDGTCSTCQMEYSMLNRPDVVMEKYHSDESPEKALLPYCHDNQIGTFIRGPLLQGLLSGKLKPNDDFQGHPRRAKWTQGEMKARYVKALELVEKLRILETPERTLPQAAIQFVLAHPDVSCTIPGATSPVQVESNAKAATGSMTDEEMSKIREITGK